MSTHTATVDITTEITATLHIMRSIQVRHLPVLAEGRLVGMVSFDDLLRCVSRQLTELADVVVVKLGSRGCRMLIEEVQLDVPGQAVAVVDSTGAGDAFDAGFLFARLAQPGVDPRAWAEAGNEAAAALLTSTRASLDL